jgi:protein-disulfide isomerase
LVNLIQKNNKKTFDKVWANRDKSIQGFKESKRMKRTIYFASALMIGSILSSSVWAQTKLPVPVAGNPVDPLGNRNQELPPALRFLQSQGVKLTSMGDADGLQSYLGEDPSGAKQTFYITPGGKMAIAGLAFRADGVNYTGLQIVDIQRRFEANRIQVEEKTRQAEAEAKKLRDQANSLDEQSHQLDGAKNQLGGNLNSMTFGNGRAPTPAVPVTKPAEATPTPTSTLVAPAPVVPPLAPLSQASPIGGASLPVPSTPASNNSADKFVSLIPQARFNELMDTQVAWFKVGVENTPVVYMVADPQCPFCHRAWAALRNKINNGELTVRVILIAGLPDSQDKAVSILSRANPGQAWNLGEGSVEGVKIAPSPDTNSEAYRKGMERLTANMTFVNEMKIIKSTPYFIYTGKDGRLYSLDDDSHLDEYLKGLVGPV